VDHLLRHLLVQFLVNDKDLMMLVRHLYVVDSFQFLILHLHLQDVKFLDALQILDEQNLDVHLPYLDVVHQLNLLVHQFFVEDVELRYQLKMDYFQVLVDLDVVDAELRYQLKTDYFLDVESQVVELLELQLLLLLQLRQLLLHLLQTFQHLAML
jgi:hypothetical protein